MGATSVTGKGPGSAEGSAKGPKERGFVGVEKLIGPRVMMAGVDALVAGSLTVTFPTPLPCVTPISAAATPPTPQVDYVIMVHDRTTATNAVTVTTTNSDPDGTTNGDNTDTCLKSFSLAGTGTDVIDWVVIKVGDAIV